MRDQPELANVVARIGIQDSAVSNPSCPENAAGQLWEIKRQRGLYVATVGREVLSWARDVPHLLVSLPMYIWNGGVDWTQSQQMG